MVVLQSFVALALALASGTAAAPDPCAKIGGKKWVSPSEGQRLLQVVQTDDTIRNNVIDVVNKTLAFHTSTNYQIQAPPPYASDVHVNLPLELARIKKQRYASEYDFHWDLSRTVKRLNDGHCTWTFGSLYINYLPIPLALLTDEKGKQHFPDQIEFWQNSLPLHLRGKLESLNGAKVLLINGLDPWAAVNANTLITGSYQAFGTRQKAFFSSYQRAAESWNYIMGNFAQQAVPLADNVLLTIQRKGTILPDTILMPYRSRFSTTATPFTDTASWRTGNCVAKPTTNGSEDPSMRFQQQPPVPVELTRKHPLNVFTDDTPLTNVVLPQPLQPSLPPVKGRLQSLKAQGATQLIIDVSKIAPSNPNPRPNNGGGYICAAHIDHSTFNRLPAPRTRLYPTQACYTKARAGPLSLAIVDEITKTLKSIRFCPTYNPRNWRAANDQFFDARTNWLRPVQEPDCQRCQGCVQPRIGQECQPEGFQKVAIISNGRCYEGAKTVVLGGKSDVKQQYLWCCCGQSLNFKADGHRGSRRLSWKSSPLAPPDLQGITWRLAFGIDNPQEPEGESSQNGKTTPPNVNLPITAAL
ncbi:hypothetical protein BKA70DRAFT_1328944 [Coprinopsis sp. MPI-PUGE-AT-0042]|nr:hypothetical protein BKA70DRAFT_1328944 [Coprinopsis sp. MPI-PUGE-AT-0042]